MACPFARRTSSGDADDKVDGRNENDQAVVCCLLVLTEAADLVLVCVMHACSSFGSSFGDCWFELDAKKSGSREGKDNDESSYGRSPSRSHEKEGALKS